MTEYEHVIAISIHHVICDGWSIDIFFTELSELYNSFQNKRPPSLPDLPIQYADFAIWQRRWLKEEIAQKQLKYWEHQLSGISGFLQLPFDKVRPKKQSYCGNFHYFKLSNSLLSSLKSFSEKYNITFFMTMVSAFNALLFRYSEQDDIIIGSAAANRRNNDVEHLIGCFINVLPLRTKLSSNITFLELTNNVRQVCLDAYENQDVPFSYVVNHLHMDRTLAWNPIFQVTIYIQTNDESFFNLEDIEVQEGDSTIVASKFDLSLWVRERKDGLSLGFEYAMDLFEIDTIEDMAEDFKILFKTIVEDPNIKIIEIPLARLNKRKASLVEESITKNHKETVSDFLDDKKSQINHLTNPRTVQEKKISEIWCEVLGIKHVSKKDNFFELGGDSILSIQLVAKARREGLVISIDQIFEFPTIEELANILEIF